MNDDDFVRDALDDAVSGVEPVDRLGAIRARTSRRTRRGWYVGGGAVLAAAAVVVAVAVVATGGPDAGDSPPVAGPTVSETAPARPTTEPAAGVVDPPGATTPVYYVGPGAGGPASTEEVLYRYFEPEGDPLELLMSQPSDPDYRTLWPRGSLLSYRVTDDAIEVSARSDATDEVGLAHQQLVYTLQGVTGTSLPVVLDPSLRKIGGEEVTITRADPIDVRSHVNISDPGERYGYSGSFVARGTGTGYEGTVACQLISTDGDAVWDGATVAGTQDRFEEWDLDVDLTGVAPGTYELACSTEDPSGGEEGGGDSYTDDRSVIVTGADGQVPPTDDTTDTAMGTVVYFAGPGPSGPEAPESTLYPERRQGYGDVLTYLMSGPVDPDYRTLWPDGSLVSYAVVDDRIEVQVAGGPVDDELARQQLWYSLNSGPDADRPVRLVTADGRDATSSAVITGQPPLDVLSHLSITEPAEGAAIVGSFVARGLSNGFEASVACSLRSGATSYGPFAGQADGWLEERLYPWELRVDVEAEQVPPGRYTLECTTDDPTGGTEGAGAAVDTRTITIT